MPHDGFFDDLFKILPPYVTRKDIGKLIGNIISPRYLANLDSAGKGPRRERLKGKVVYKREDFVVWLKSWIRSPG